MQIEFEKQLAISIHFINVKFFFSKNSKCLNIYVIIDKK